MNPDLGDQSLQWLEPDRMDSLASIQDMDFSNFVDIGDLDLSSYSPIGQDHQQQNPHHVGQAPSSRQSAGDASIFQPNHIHDFAPESFEIGMSLDQEQPMQGGHDFTHQANTAIVNNQDWSHQQQQQQQQQNMQDHVYQHPQHIPPTPNSYEMHGNPGPFVQQHMDPQTRAFLEQRYQLRKDDAMAFTPLVHSAVTPQDSHFQTIPEFTVPGAYFSPLTSPALQAQNGPHQHHMTGYNTRPSTSNNSVATSPIDLNVDEDMMSSSGTLSEPLRRTTRKSQNPRSTGPSARVRQSPIVKPQQKRKSTHLASVIPTKEKMDSILREARDSQPLSAGLVQSGQLGSGTESISPEPLSESLMGPPPRPGSTMHSPALIAQAQSAPASANVTGMPGAPATPASLMALQRRQKLSLKQSGDASTPASANTSPRVQDDTDMFDDFALPPAANTEAPRPSLERIVVSTPVSADATPRLIARKTPKLGPGNTPLSALAPNSSTSSPLVSAVNSPVLAATPSSMAGRRLESKPGPRAGKKRGSIGGPMISPAIRPKISPSIKPLLPEGAKLDESQQALLLASKSNYTHILEGTLLPGMNYPESLSSGLTSKRTSHKLAEQGRRNRINDALKEMQALLPRAGGSKPKSTSGTAAADEDEEESKDSPKTTGTAAAAAAAAAAESKSASSKAATVESAIEYIKALQHERAQTARMLSDKDAEIAALRRKLEKSGINAGECGGSGSTNGSVSGGGGGKEAEMVAEKDDDTTTVDASAGAGTTTMTEGKQEGEDVDVME